MDSKRSSPHKSAAPRSAHEKRVAMEEAKRLVIDNLESMRGSRAEKRVAAPVAPDLSMRSREELEHEVVGLRTELKHVRAASALLEHDMHRLEQKALEAISETGRLRQTLDTINAHKSPLPGTLQDYVEERNELLRRVELAEEERILLAGALQDSEREIARLAKSLDQFTRKYCES